ncbi:hypothetical protein IQ254_03890 [Nodosilinea sp. LEGE 07088]|uniref:hypothetical protein n=1 Tax=Nodosilinea sp. LEGE 07088 TaxID=2777968 RepID=UPI00187F3859|nr:hypothetical protein [Nodosilinea sp. LEGE 07088]MBE9136350.1 hypothetical protein [Nodosilinea sp. LEGE 07088]
MQSLFLKTALWLTLEFCLTAVGLDDMADYSEYLFKIKEFLPTPEAALAQYQCLDGICTPRNVLPPAFVSTAYSL